MPKHNKFKNESQDARRHDQQQAVHPDKMKPTSEHERSKFEPDANKKKPH
jgi:hypothetical protein